MDPLAATRVADLVSAVEHGDADYVNKMLALHAPVDAADVLTGNSALHAAVLYHVELLPELLKHADNPDALDIGGATPLSCVVHELSDTSDASRRQQLVDAATHLLRAGADPRAGASDQSALELARLYELPEVEALLVRGCAVAMQ